MNRYEANFPLMGTMINLLIYHTHGEKVLNEAYNLLLEFETRFTVNRTHSELMEINKNAGRKPIYVKEDIFELIKLSKNISIQANNPFNIAIGPLVKAWRIGFNNAKHPTDQEIADCLSLVNPKNILLNQKDKTIYLTKERMELDLGSIAKGYFADQIKKIFLNHGVSSGFIDLGGNVLTIGCSPNNLNNNWVVGIQNPFKPRGNMICAVLTKDCSVVTSGIYERFLSVDNKRYHHILDSITGAPIITNIASITIISKQSLDGEIWSTAGFLSNAQQSIEFLNQQTNIEAIVITCDERIYLTNGLVRNNLCIQKIVE
ncbi:FAD:protein FMN transferase [Gilliamella sp. ESL0443]|uniref:FAD:protein FMN transferase n=1 Tax=Gilliamella sp. ESL0443 TaxID=2704655 RepID=UPI001C6A75A9|nr:FAD:protein FMN transferase [Gilliamella sp. ESL0443]QYN42456.1 FAD:protein FMN transferase [Gilliamella sp. ESL0443]